VIGKDVLSAKIPSETDVNSPEKVDVYQLLDVVRQYKTQADIAQQLGVDARTVRRWEVRQSEPPAYLIRALQYMLPLEPIEPAQLAGFTFIDLFAGIGGLRQAFEQVGGQCVFTSEWDRYAQKTYFENFRDRHPLNGDITKVEASEVPDHDVLLAGFPCQPFSIAGVSKKNALGRAHGFQDETQGTLFFDVARIIAEKQPRAFLLENVKNLMSHDKGRTFDVIRRTLREELGYDIHCKVIDGAHFTPQHRERILIVGFREPVVFDWEALPLPTKGQIKLKDILHRIDGSEPKLPWDGERFFNHSECRVPDKYTLTPKLWAYLQTYAEKHRAKGNGFGFGLVGPDSVTRTLSARYYKDGSEILVDQGEGRNPRRLTPRECARLMGFPDTFRIPVSDTRAYQLLAMAATPPMIAPIATAIRQRLDDSATVVTRQTELPKGLNVASKNWTREQILVAINLYCQLPFGKLHKGNPIIIETAKLLGRTPDALAMT
jgi:DNA (cytosine-5)-methyltransferase 1